jgi:L-asparaginase
MLDEAQVKTQQTGLPNVVVIGTGGTISLDGRHSLDTYEYVDLGQRRPVHDIVARFPELAKAARVRPINFRLLSSSAVSSDDWLELNDLIHRVAEGPDATDGIVVAHGTGTMEETAYS